MKAKGYAAIPISGQDGDTANLQNVAAGIQYVDVWKVGNELGKAAGAAALALCNSTEMADLALPDGLVLPANAPTAGNKVQDFTTWVDMVKSFILTFSRSPRRTCSSSSTPKSWLHVLCKNAATWANPRRGLQRATC